MEISNEEELVLRRFRAKTIRAGGAKTGFLLRRTSIKYGLDPQMGLDLDGALTSLVESGVLAVNEEGSLFFLTEQGVVAVEELA